MNLDCEYDMDLLSNPSDDHIAAIGCVLAFVVSGGLMYVSFFVGRIGRKSKNPDTLRREADAKTAHRKDGDERKAA